MARSNLAYAIIGTGAAARSAGVELPRIDALAAEPFVRAEN